MLRKIPNKILLALVTLLCQSNLLTSQESVLHWKAVLVAASAEGGLEQWDHARLDLQEQLVRFGLEPRDIIMLSAKDSHIGRTENGSQVQAATSYNIRFALEDLYIQSGDAVVLFITSHGAEQGGISLWRSRSYLSVEGLSEILSIIPADIPTVLLLSACYSGQFIQGRTASSPDGSGKKDLKAENRIILTASRNDRASFGCGGGGRTTVWDGILLEELAKAEISVSWSELARRISHEVDRSEEGYSPQDKSFPQAFFGTMTQNLPFLGAKRSTSAIPINMDAPSNYMKVSRP